MIYIVNSKTKELKILERTGVMLRLYRSGKIPKILKILPILENFEEFLWYTRPDLWSYQALFVVTRFFLSKLNKKQTQRFFSLILVPRIQELLFRKKKINPLIVKLLKFTTKNGKAFFYDIMTPLCISRKCSNQESAFFASFITNQSFYQSNVTCFIAIILRDEFIFGPKISILRAIISKKYNLPNKILELLIDFFFLTKEKLGQQNFKKCFLIFVKNYSRFFSKEDKKKLLKIF